MQIRAAGLGGLFRLAPTTRVRHADAEPGAGDPDGVDGVDGVDADCRRAPAQP